VKKMEKYLRWIPDPAERELYAQRVAQKTGIRSTIRGRSGAPRGRAPNPGRSPGGRSGPALRGKPAAAACGFGPVPGAQGEGGWMGGAAGRRRAREVLDRLADLAQRDPSGRAASLLDGSLPRRCEAALAETSLRLAAEEARRRYPAAVGSCASGPKKRQIESRRRRSGRSGQGEAGIPSPACWRPRRKRNGWNRNADPMKREVILARRKTRRHRRPGGKRGGRRGSSPTTS
jgi:hypothetical protein